MPSILPNYEHDIFISYRHKDNRSGWITHFVAALQEELDSTFKENISIYIDENLHDGLLETHDVDKSLKGKLKSIIFIPIVSHTYCDPKSFAWQYEFCAFNQMAIKGPIGRDILLDNGNVASRILPITIHDLDSEDIALIETELQTKFRYIEFTFRSPGVNRALRKDDKREDNIGRLTYRDQMNKVANALKEIVQAIKSPEKIGYTGIPISDEDSSYLKSSTVSKPKPAPASNEKSIAVLPFMTSRR